MAKFKINRFWSTAMTLVVVYALIKWGIPAASRNITALPFPLSVPSTLMFIYMVLTVVALFLLVTFSDEYMEEFLRPVNKFLRGEYGRTSAVAGTGSGSTHHRLADVRDHSTES